MSKTREKCEFHFLDGSWREFEVTYEGDCPPGRAIMSNRVFQWDDNGGVYFEEENHSQLPELICHHQGKILPNKPENLPHTTAKCDDCGLVLWNEWYCPENKFHGNKCSYEYNSNHCSYCGLPRERK